LFLHYTSLTALHVYSSCCPACDAEMYRFYIALLYAFCSQYLNRGCTQFFCTKNSESSLNQNRMSKQVVITV